MSVVYYAIYFLGDFNGTFRHRPFIHGYRVELSYCEKVTLRIPFYVYMSKIYTQGTELRNMH
jgi:hypothetical protein